MTSVLEVATEHWRVIAAKTVGSSHLREGTECEDHFAIHSMENGIYLVAVADGAGSARYGSTGARVAVEAAIDSLKVCLAESHEPSTEDAWAQTMTSALDSAKIAIIAHAQYLADAETVHSIATGDAQLLNHTTSPHDFATTLLMAALSSTWVAVMHIGDGMVVTANAAEEYCCPIAYDRNDNQYLNVTHFITDPDYDKWARSAAFDARNLKGIALLTDGLQLLAYSLIDSQPYAPFFSPLFTYALAATATDKDLEAFLTSKRVSERTDDDKTLVVAVRI